MYKSFLLKSQLFLILDFILDKGYKYKKHKYYISNISSNKYKR